MKETVRFFNLMSDETRLRILALLTKRELCVCQLMGVLGISQPLVSRNLSLLNNAGLLDERREGKLIFYSVKKDLPPTPLNMLKVLKTELKNDALLAEDLNSLTDCYEFQKQTGNCDMKTFLDFMERQRRKRSGREQGKTSRGRRR